MYDYLRCSYVDTQYVPKKVTNSSECPKCSLQCVLQPLRRVRDASSVPALSCKDHVLCGRLCVFTSKTSGFELFVVFNAETEQTADKLKRLALLHLSMRADV